MSRGLAIFESGDAGASGSEHGRLIGRFIRPADLALSLERLSALARSGWDRVGAGGLDQLRQWAGQRLLHGTILACAALNLTRRTEAGARIEREWRRLALLVRRAWAEAEGFEAEAVAGIALVVLTLVILVHGLGT
jgi:hypothetical protein